MSIAIPTNTRLIPDLKSALALKCFIGQDRANGFGADHPLGCGFHAIRKFLTSGRLLAAEWQAVVDLNLSAEIILRSLRGLVEDHQLLSDLCNSERCRALLFEAHVAEFVLRRSVRQIGWRRYVPGRSDFLTDGPQLQVECKLATKNASVEGVVKKAFERVDQWRDGDGPFVLVAGCDAPIDSADIQAIPRLIGAAAARWFGRHPEVAAVIAMLPEHIPPAQRDPAVSYRTLQFRNGSAVTFRSNVSTTPLPLGFDFKIRGS
jgi:hypothetical protein